jgi:hypothetical protein
LNQGFTVWRSEEATSIGVEAISDLDVSVDDALTFRMDLLMAQPALKSHHWRRLRSRQSMPRARAMRAACAGAACRPPLRRGCAKRFFFSQV